MGRGRRASRGLLKGRHSPQAAYRGTGGNGRGIAVTTASGLGGVSSGEAPRPPVSGDGLPLRPTPRTCCPEAAG
jgi:hypothetical protein